MRNVASDPNRREKYVAAVDAALEAGNPDAFARLFEHGFGRPPQALDITSGGEPVRFDLTLRVVSGVGSDGKPRA